MTQLENLNIEAHEVLVTPEQLKAKLPVSEEVRENVQQARDTVHNILARTDKRLLVVVGPCSIHDVVAAKEYALKLTELAQELKDSLFIVMRAYFEKPRTTTGWKGLINDPDLDGTFRINRGLRLARGLLCNIADIGLPAATEFLDTTFGQYYADLISWGAIGARTVESQIHRELASGLSMPVGIKNRTDGDIQVAIDAIRAAGHKHLFPSLTKEGAPAILETRGNPDCHLVLRGGEQPNFDATAVSQAQRLLKDNELPETVMVDCSHGNSGKDPIKQLAVAHSISEQRKQGNTGLRAIMVESHLVGGRQDLGSDLVPGQSITDACLGFDETRELLETLARR